MINRLYCVLLLLIALPVIAQDRQLLHGKTLLDNTEVSGVFVINKNTGIETKTNASGNFSILASPGDILIFYNSKIIVREIKLTQTSFTIQPFVITVNYTANELDELVIEKNITSESLGLVSKGQKKNTPRERRLFTAGDFKPIHLLGLLGGSLNVDAIINKINGRTDKIKKEIVIERKMAFMDRINNIYSEEDIVREFKVPKEYVQGFVFYVSEDPEFAANMKAQNTTMAKFLMTGLAEKYLKLIPNE
ncbi:hypothetical protein [Flavobacterium cerinum]|uniref:Carboxypeptidase-like regulatory domain-containing protein n=1 Tax=Flavobacterium cerinum TaxID=2502784 RepID=A0A3S3TT93_9FLAO|nr:hypothetical protein [Flavobacterium cerinum]RWW92305.1 hypothetical protein EPI11_15445 [Flavobacterium cerinum]